VIIAIEKSEVGKLIGQDTKWDVSNNFMVIITTFGTDPISFLSYIVVLALDGTIYRRNFSSN
jgi:hypothetical protein